MNGLPLTVHKPFDKVLHFLHERENAGELPEGSRLPTAEALAAHLDVSPGTVKNVYRTLAREGRVKTQVGVGSFWLGGRESKEKRLYRIGFYLPGAIGWEERKTNNTGWGGAIFGGILRRKLERGLNVDLAMYGGVEALKKGDGAGGVDGVIDFSLQRNVTFPPGLPVVHLNPPVEWACVNFVAPDYYHCSRVLGETWRIAGRRRILFVTCDTWGQSVSALMRYSGLLAGIGDAISRIDVRVFEASAPRGEDGRAVAKLLDDWVPDAVYCIGDLLARGVLQALEERGISVPDEVSIVGGCKTESGSERPSITSMAHPLDTVGASLFDAAIQRIQSGGRDTAGRYEPVPFLLGETTTPAENEMLFQHARSSNVAFSVAPLL